MKDLIPFIGSSLSGYRVRSLFFLLSFFGQALYLSAQETPNCIELNAAIDLEGQSKIAVDEFVANINDSGPVKVVIRIPNGSILAELENAVSGDTLYLEACGYRTSDVRIYVSNEMGSCESPVHFIESKPISFGYHDTVYCHEINNWDTNRLPLFISDTTLQFKSACREEITYKDIKANPKQYYANVWEQEFRCDTSEELSFCKRYIKEFEYFDKNGNRILKYDTLSILNYAKITPDRLLIKQEDTIYCGQQYVETLVSFVHEIEVNGSPVCDTVPMVIHDKDGIKIMECFQGECKLAVKTSEKDVFESQCITTKGISFQFIQTCWQPGSADPGSCAVDTPPEVASGDPKFGKFVVDLWLTVLDTSSPVIQPTKEILKATTDSHDCEASLVIPEITIDDCSGVRKAYVNVPGEARFEMKRNSKGKWTLAKSITVSSAVADTSYVLIEAIDSCGNKPAVDTIYYASWDQVNPVAIANQTLIAGLTKKVNWLKAESINEGSRDNCGIVHVFARRMDWYEACGVNFCDKKITGEVEERYQNWYDWIKQDDVACADLIINEWDQDIAYRCPTTDEHGNTSTAVRPQMGGGWMDAIPYCCEDACKEIKVELLIIDTHCNWSKAWTTVTIEDKQPVQVLTKLTSGVEISCTTYETKYKEIVEKAMIYNNEPLTNIDRIKAFTALDNALGGYEKVWIDPQTGASVDENGKVVTPFSRTIDSKYCVCETKTRKVAAIDEHTGEEIWVYEEYEECKYLSNKTRITNGLVAVNCNGTVYEDIWVNLDDCGRGYIDRRFKISGGCLDPTGDHVSQSETIIQRIYIGNTCELSVGMFDLPTRELEVDVCEIESDLSGNLTGDLHPDITGTVKYTFGDPCAFIGVGYYDQVYKLNDNSNNKTKVIRTWCMTDWCNTVGDDWMHKDDPNVIKWEQILIVTTGQNCNTQADYRISGTVINPRGITVNNVILEIENQNNVKQEYTTGSNGSFNFTVSNEDENIMSAKKQGYILNGVNIADLLAIQRHILNVNPFTDELKVISGDVNEDGVVNSKDYLEIKRVLLEQEDSFSSGKTWKIVFQSNLQESRVFSFIMENQTVNLYGLKLGDVTYDASLNRSNNVALLSTQDVKFGAGSFVDVDFKIKGLKTTEGIQLGLNFDTRLLYPTSIKMNGRVLSEENYAVKEGQILIIDDKLRNWDSQSDNIEVQFETLASGKLSEGLKFISNKENIAVADGEKVNLELSFDNQTELELLVYQNQPNPFSTFTNIDFKIDASQLVTLDIMDHTGKQVFTRSENFPAGQNQIRLLGSDLPGSGVYIYRLRTDKNTVSRKMILIE